MTRRTRSRTARIRIFDDSGGMCHICGTKIHIGEDWQLDHAIPLACGGSDTDDNLFPAHTACHSGKTKTDVKDAAKIKRVRARHLGVKKQQSRPMAGTKASGIRKRMNGDVERWT